jgi:uncharacterized protein
MPLPLFPLHLVLFPGRPLPLHLFEPRYREMLRDCLAADRRFGVVAIESGREVGDAAKSFPIGTVAVIESVEELPDGRFDILTRGTQRFRIERMVTGTPYLAAEVTLLDEVPPGEQDHEQARQLRDLLKPYLLQLGAPEELLDRLPSDPHELGWLAASALQVEIPQQQHLLELDRCSDRLVAAARILRRETGIMRHLGTVGSLRPPGPGGAELN